MDDLKTARISPTAHYTGYVWYVSGISPAAMKTRLGKLLYVLLLPLNLAYRAFTRAADINLTLLARHRIIDYCLDAAIKSGKVGQVIEVASGLSSRGLRFSKRYPEITYIEGDLENIRNTKIRLLDESGLRLSANHHVVEIDILLDSGPNSLCEVANRLLDSSKGCAIVMEGLAGYFPKEVLHDIWLRSSRCLDLFPSNLYLSDIFLARDIPRTMLWMSKILEILVRGKVYFQFTNPPDCQESLRSAGFQSSNIHDLTSFHHVGLAIKERDYPCRIIEASTS